MSYREWINTKTNRTYDQTRILGIVAAGRGAENYLPYTIPKIVKQISEIEMSADILIGLNNGFECSSVIESFTLLPDTQVIHLYTEEKISSAIPAKIFENLKCEGEPYHLSNIEFQKFKHRIFVIHQQEGLYSAGKIRVLGDIYKLLLNSIDNGWIPPALLVTFDAESQLLLDRGYSVPDIESNGLMLIVSELKHKLKIDLIGTRNKFAVYQKGIVSGITVLLPNFNEEIPPIQWFVNVVHGKISGFKWQPGGGTVGRTDAIVSLLAVISEKYPGTRSEDTHLTILAKHTGFLSDILVDVVSINRTPSISDTSTKEPPKKAWIEQMYRWSAAGYALELNYGKHNVISIAASTSFSWSVLKAPVEFLNRSDMKKISFYSIIKRMRVLLIALFTFNRISKKVLEKPDILQGSTAKASW